MKVINMTHNPDIASVYIAKTSDGHFIEFVQSLQPPLPIEKKWVIILSSLIGCPIECQFCEAGGKFKRILTKDELLSQINYILNSRNIKKRIKSEKFKIQFARIGEPSFNPFVLELLSELPALFDAPGIIPCISTIAPKGRDSFFDSLLMIKKKIYKYNFQLQFSVHSTSNDFRDYLIPASKWKIEEIAEYGNLFYDKNGRKITLNFAATKDAPISTDIIRKLFNPDKFLIKFTPVNPTLKASQNKIISYIDPNTKSYPIIEKLKSYGYTTIISIGELEENKIGSNCGQYITNFSNNNSMIDNAYTYPIQEVQQEDHYAKDI